MAAIFGPSSPSTYGIVASIAARFDVPHIDYFWRQNEELHADQEPKNPKPMTINFFPDSEMVGKVSQLLQKFLKNLEKQISPCLRAIYKLWIDIRQLIFENVDNSIPDRSKFPRYSHQIIYPRISCQRKGIIRSSVFLWKQKYRKMAPRNLSA